MKPLLGMIAYNRKGETEETLRSLLSTYADRDSVIYVCDNGSQDGTAQMLGRIEAEYPGSFTFVDFRENKGCPRALNFILEVRQPGQHFIKVDNDVRLLTPEWVYRLSTFLDDHPDVALVGPWYEELETANQGRVIADHGDWLEIFPIVGHCVMHRGEFLDRSGFFDVLAIDHLYGFEDLLMAHRAAALGYKCAVFRKVKLQNLQRHNSLDVGRSKGTNAESRDEHVERLRPLYERRRELIHQQAGSYFVAANGQTRE